MATYWENSCSFGLRYVSWYKYLIVSLVFSHLGFWSGNLFLIAPFPDLCPLVPLDLDFSCKFSKLQFNSLAFVAGFKRATDEGSLPEIAQFSPYYLPLNVLIPSKGSNLYSIFGQGWAVETTPGFNQWF